MSKKKKNNIELTDADVQVYLNSLTKRTKLTAYIMGVLGIFMVFGFWFFVFLVLGAVAKWAWGVMF